MDKNGIKETNHLLTKLNFIKKENYKTLFKNVGNFRTIKNKAKFRKLHIKLSISNEKKIIKKRIYLYIFSFLIILFFILLLLYKYVFLKTEAEIEDFKLIYNKEIEKDYNEEYNDIQNYMDLIFTGTKLYENKIYYNSKRPKISIVISAYNGEAFLKTAILSIQNQDLKDIEIIIVDDCSKDNTISLIKELMITEPRIVLYKNDENKGTLYTKSKGILLAKGKYVMTLDEDDIYVQKDAFSSLYAEAEKNNLDILVFIFIHSGVKLSKYKYIYSNKRNIIYQPELSHLNYYFNSKKQVIQFGGNLANVFVKTNLLKKAIKLIDEKNMNAKMFCHEDFILFFLLTRIANNIKYINRVFYVVPHIWKNNNPKVKFRNEIKEQDKKTKRCLSYINFLEIIFKNTYNTFKDKKIAFSQLEKWYLNNHCKSNKYSREKAIEVFKLYLESKYISIDDKKKFNISLLILVIFHM